MVGTGSTATQIVPAIQPIVRQLYVFQREPGWVMPKGERDFTAEERAAFANPWRRRQERLRLKWLLEKNIWGGKIFRVDTKENAARRQFCLDYIDRSFEDRPDLRDAVTPTLPVPGQAADLRVSTFYPALKEPNVELVPKAVASVTPDRDRRRRRRRTRDRRPRDGDRLPARELPRAGCRSWAGPGSTLQEYWAGEPHAYLGITVPEFPNFFILYGPGTNGGEIVTMLESQAEYVVRAMQAHAPRARHRRRGEAALRGAAGTAGSSTRCRAPPGR